jgi:hypothetical protein
MWRTASLLAVPIEGVDVLVTNKAVDGKTLAELAALPAARGVFLRKITRGATATDIPSCRHRGQRGRPASRSSGRTQDTAAATKLLGVADRPTDVTDMAFVGAAIVVGAADRRARLQGRRASRCTLSTAAARSSPASSAGGCARCDRSSGASRRPPSGS